MLQKKQSGYIVHVALRAIHKVGRSRRFFCAIGYAVSFPAMALGLPVGFINCLIFSTSSRADATRFSTVSLAWSTIV